MKGRRVPINLPAFEMLGPGECGDIDLNLKFDCSDYSYKAPQDLLQEAKDCEIWLHFQVTFIGDEFQCPHQPIGFLDYVLRYPPLPPVVPASTPTRGLHISRDWFAKLQEEFPWLTQEDFPAATGHKSDRRGATPSDPPEPRGRALTPHTDEEVALEVRRRLLDRRKVWAEECSDIWFYVTVRGGGWTYQFKGVVADVVSMYARNCAKDWCDVYGLPKQKGFTIARYTEEGAHRLSWAWVRKLNFFFEMWQDNGSHPGYVYSAEQLEAYVADAAFLDWTDELDDGSYCYLAVAELINAVPRNPFFVG